VSEDISALAADPELAAFLRHQATRARAARAAEDTAQVARVLAYTEAETPGLIDAARRVERWRGHPSLTRIGRELGVAAPLADALAQLIAAIDPPNPT